MDYVGGCFQQLQDRKYWAINQVLPNFSAFSYYMPVNKAINLEEDSYLSSVRKTLLNASKVKENIWDWLVIKSLHAKTSHLQPKGYLEGDL